ncbi:LytTR family transcriptional regulator DNA-binding domain-containing protein [Parapedobacter sp. 2B3]|uniref:LytTR family transcriptional regulator DNA-binding domain-containing protein n=1 Tax=Parapedobacter sp. 2B3 TaxID=3342381 RepID=UPI0035B618C2
MNNKKIFIKTLKKATVVSCSDIISCEADGSYVQIQTRQGAVLTACKSLTQVHKDIEVAYIIRISQSALVNVHCLTHVHYKDREVELANGKRIHYTVKKRELEGLIDNGLSVDFEDTTPI